MGIQRSILDSRLRLFRLSGPLNGKRAAGAFRVFKDVAVRGIGIVVVDPKEVPSAVRTID